MPRIHAKIDLPMTTTSLYKDGLDLSDLAVEIESKEAFPDAIHKAYVTFFNHKVSDEEEQSALLCAKSSEMTPEDYFAQFPTKNQDSLDQLRVLAYSLHNSGTELPLVVLSLVTPSKNPNFYAAHLEPLKNAFNVKFLFIDADKDLGKLWKSKYPGSLPNSYDSFSRGDILTAQQARFYNKIYAWRLTMFDKLVYLETNNLVRKKLDNLFDEPQFSGVPLVGNSFNTAVLVIQPDTKIFDELVSQYSSPSLKYLGDQAFLNHYFFNVTSRLVESPHELPSTYNLNVRCKNFAIWPTLKKQAAIWHLNGPVRPWDFYKAKSTDWDAYFEPNVFYEWIQCRRAAILSLGLASLRQPSLIKNKEWPNSARTKALCDRYTVNYNPKRHQSNISQFCVLIGTWDRLDLLPTVIAHYQASPFVSKIYITWHNPASRPPKSLLKIMELNTRNAPGKPPIEFLYQKFDSLNNRFNPLDRLDTQAVLICDDDIMVNLEDIHFAFRVWQENQQSLVGLFARAHTYHMADKAESAAIDATVDRRPEDHVWLYHVSAREATPYNSYSIILTKFMFMSADYLFAYSCLLPEEVHRYVDQGLNCEDIAMTLMISGMTGAKHLAVLAPIIDFGTTSGISAKSGHLDSRSICLTDLIKIMGINSLESSIEVIQQYTPPTA
jgi:glycogenin